MLFPTVTGAQSAVTWSTSTAAGDNDSWRAIAYDATTTRYVAVGLGTDRVMYSTTTSTWTAASAAADAHRASP